MVIKKNNFINSATIVNRIVCAHVAILFPPQGNYIMFASATSGERPNNSKFSNCSIGNISAVLDAIEEQKKKNCFSGDYG